VEFFVWRIGVKGKGDLFLLDNLVSHTTSIIGEGIYSLRLCKQHGRHDVPPDIVTSLFSAGLEKKKKLLNFKSINTDKTLGI
jgi:hypothetical protein